jgi:beta-N-acetylhexosaminidase
LKEGLGFQPLPSAADFAKLTLPVRKELLASALKEMKSLGIDVDLGPVVDINYNPKNPDIGAIGRSFSAKVSEVRENAKLWAELATEAGIRLCLKHYPGLGGATTNSHEALTDISASITDEQVSLFFELLPTIPGSLLLLSHGIVRQWEENTPVSISPVAVQKIRLSAPDAILVTDDLQMQGLQAMMSTSEAILKGMHIGVDMFIIGNNLLDEQEDCFQIAEDLEKHFSSGVQESLKRIEKNLKR